MEVYIHFLTDLHCNHEVCSATETGRRFSHLHREADQVQCDAACNKKPSQIITILLGALATYYVDYHGNLRRKTEAA